MIYKTHASIMVFILAMAMNPSVQRRAQEELDQVVGKDRLPTFSDRDSLPYIQALILEVLRWGSIVPLNVPHRLTEEYVYNGMRIPKGAIVIANMRFGGQFDIAFKSHQNNSLEQCLMMKAYIPNRQSSNPKDSYINQPILRTQETSFLDTVAGMIF